MDTVRESFAITLVLGLLWFTLWWLKRRGVAAFSSPFRTTGERPEMRLVSNVRLSAQHAVYLIRIKDREMVLGVHPGGMTILNETEIARD